jgi:GT2 family glycosyltransferase
VRVLDVELSRAPGAAPVAEPGVHVRALVRLHGHPLGSLDYVATSAATMKDVVAFATSALQQEIEVHAAIDGVAPAELMGAPLADPTCLRGGPKRGEEPLVSIVVPTRDRPDLLVKFLESAVRVDYPFLEIIAVDNSPDPSETYRIVHDLGDERVRALHVPCGGSSAARNAGLAAAQGAIIASTDDDAELDRNWLRMLVRRFELVPEAGAVTGLVVPASLHEPAELWFEEYGGFGKGYTARVFDVEPTSHPDRLYPWLPGVFGSGNNVAFRRNVLDEIGGYDLRFGPGSPIGAAQDLDVFLKVLHAGYRIAYEPAAVVRHHHRSDAAGLERQLRNYGRGMSALLTKWALSDRRNALDIARRVPRGLAFLVSPKSSKNARRTQRFPPRLIRAELAGMATGWFAFLRVRRLPPR